MDGRKTALRWKKHFWFNCPLYRNIISIFSKFGVIRAEVMLVEEWNAHDKASLCGFFSGLSNEIQCWGCLQRCGCPFLFSVVLEVPPFTAPKLLVPPHCLLGSPLPHFTYAPLYQDFSCRIFLYPAARSQEPILNTDTDLWRRPWSVRISRLSWCGLSSLKFNSTAWISGFSGLGIRPKRSGILGELVRHCLWVWRWGCLFVIWWLFLPKLSTVPSIESLSKTEGNGRLGLSSLCLPEMRHHLLALMTLVFRGFRLRLGFTPPAMGCQAFVLHNQIPKSPSWRWLTYTCIQNPLMHVCSQFPSFTDPD